MMSQSILKTMRESFLFNRKFFCKSNETSLRTGLNSKSRIIKSYVRPNQMSSFGFAQSGIALPVVKMFTLTDDIHPYIYFEIAHELLFTIIIEIDIWETKIKITVTF